MKNTLATYSIRDLENISGIKAHTLRIWEQRYDILQPKRTDTNIRFYEDDDLRLILSISMLNHNGYKISQIAKMSASQIHQACGSLQDVSEEFSSQINALTLSMIEMDTDRFESTISVCSHRFGFEQTMIRIIYPFFERVGVLWQTGTITIVQEHFISNLIRQKIIVAIDALPNPKAEGVPKFALFLPVYEMHELSLLFAAYIVKSRGNHLIYLGQNVPEDDLAAVYEAYHPDYFLTLLTINPPKETIQTLLTRFGKSYPKSRFLVSGSAIVGVEATPDNVILLKQMQDINRYVDFS